MKKLLYLLGVISLAMPISSSTISCFGSSSTENEFDWSKNSAAKTNNRGDGTSSSEQDAAKASQVKNQEWENVLNGTYINPLSNIKTYGTTSNDFMKDDITSYQSQTKINFDPYADAGIVADSAEYMLKQEGLSSSQYDTAVDCFKSENIENYEYNNLKNYKSEIGKNLDGIRLGFMQNASDSNEIVPMFNAAPAKDNNGILSEDGKGTEYAEWFNKRINDWGITENKNFTTISFGPFSNSLWHEAWKNNKTPEELAQTIKSIGDRYNTKKFDFYFASPYLSHSGNYYDSQRLLAAALKVLLDYDSTYDFTLSLVTSTKDGLSLQQKWNGNFSQIGDEICPLYTFTKFLGMNFRLNLVPYLTMTQDVVDQKDWEVSTIENAVDNSFDTWLKIYSVLSDQKDIVSNENIEQTRQKYNRHISVTPWIGSRAEAGTYNLDAKKVLEIREWANEKKYGEISMFYISRDFPSEYISNGGSIWSEADKNALDQNVRSGTLYKPYTYSSILSGEKQSVDDEEDLINKDEYTSNEKILSVYSNHIDEFEKNNNADIPWSDPSDPNGQNGGTPYTPNDSVSLYTSQEKANPNRTKKITSKTKSDGITYFSPYVDAGLYQGNDINDVNKTLSADGNGSTLQGLTLAFVQQSNTTGNDKLDLSIAGVQSSGDSYTWWEDSMLWDKMLEPMAKAGKYNMVKVAYGGASTGANTEKNPWNVAYEMSNHNIENAADILVTGLTNYQNYLKELASKKGCVVSTPKSIDFDIEGNAQNDTEQLKVLATALAKMKKSDSSWNFSITLPTLDSGLTTLGYSVLNTFVKTYSEKGLDQKEIPSTNLMLMDYGNPIYEQAISQGETNFDLAKSAIEETRNNIATSINDNYGKLYNQGKDLYSKIGATPMIGVNDTVSGVFTLEDAKELYNYANTVGLSYIGMWSLNDDHGKVSGKASMKSLVSHGLTYLSDYDFTEAFSGIWSDKVLNDK